jgi:uncharacterized repeat protein (TIGR03803 family)
MLHFHLVTRLVAALVAVAVAGCSGGRGSTSGPLPQTDAVTVGAGQRSTSSIALQPSAVKYKYKSLYSFQGGGLDGALPQAGLTNDNGTLYGTTLLGGGVFNCNTEPPSPTGCGTIFKITTSGAESILHYFQGGADGALPQAGLTNVNHGTLYGTTTAGGYPYGGGSVFKITTLGANTVLYDFVGGLDGIRPEGDLFVDVHGTLYGTTSAGGGSGCAYGAGCGTVFKISSSGKESVLHSFTGTPDGAEPFAGLTNVNGTLYGTTSQGGQNCDPNVAGCGTVFKISSSGTETVLHRFTGTPDGEWPAAGLTKLNGTLYGTTFFGGTGTSGTVFKITTSGTETVLYRFTGTPDGAQPAAGLTNVNGTLYGTTSYGGTYGAGTVFELSPSGTERVLYSFRGGSDGVSPNGLIAVNGTLYGTTYVGGTGPCNYGVPGCGTVFSISL